MATDENTESTENPQPQPVDSPLEEGRSFTIEGNDTSGYVGVDPEYRNYANETDRPILSDEVRERMKEHGHLTDDEAVEQGRGLWSPPGGEGTPEATVVADTTGERSNSDVERTGDPDNLTSGTSNAGPSDDDVNTTLL